jgi:hypothetical protein
MTSDDAKEDRIPVAIEGDVFWSDDPKIQRWIDAAMASENIWFGICRTAYEAQVLRNLPDIGPLLDFVGPPMPDNFLPEMTTRRDPITDSELRIGRYRDREINVVLELGYILSMRDDPEGWRKEQPRRDADLRLGLWNGMEAARLMNNSATARLALQQVGLISDD